MMSTDQLIQIDQQLCTRCGHCGDVCPVQAIGGNRREPQSIAPELCVKCGQCVQVCSAFDSLFDEPEDRRAQRLQERALPSGLSEPLFAAYDRNFLPEIDAALMERNLRTVVHCDAAVFGPLAEEFGMPAGSIKPGKIVTALRMLGFHRVYSNTFSAGVAILEQAKELSDRVQNGGNLPLINASCPAAVQFIEQSFPELIHYLSVCRSPRQIAGSLTKACLAKEFNLNPAYLFSVSLASCTAHKFEATRSELRRNGNREIDAVFTTRELAWLMKRQGIEPTQLGVSEFDTQMPLVPEMETVFCHTGDVAQSVLSTMADMVDAPDAAVELAGVEGAAAFSKVRVGSRDYVAVSVSGLQNAVPFLEAARNGKSPVRFLEIMACPQGCISGGGQPKVLLPRQKSAVYEKRAAVVAPKHSESKLRLTQNAAIGNLYDNTFGKPIGDKSNNVLHTQYVERADEYVRKGSVESSS